MIFSRNLYRQNNLCNSILQALICPSSLILCGLLPNFHITLIQKEYIQKKLSKTWKLPREPSLEVHVLISLFNSYIFFLQLCMHRFTVHSFQTESMNSFRQDFRLSKEHLLTLWFGPGSSLPCLSLYSMALLHHYSSLAMVHSSILTSGLACLILSILRILVHPYRCSNFNLQNSNKYTNILSIFISMAKWNIFKLLFLCKMIGWLN